MISGFSDFAGTQTMCGIGNSQRSLWKPCICAAGGIGPVYVRYSKFAGIVMFSQAKFATRPLGEIAALIATDRATCFLVQVFPAKFPRARDELGKLAMLGEGRNHDGADY